MTRSILPVSALCLAIAAAAPWDLDGGTAQAATAVLSPGCLVTKDGGEQFTDTSVATCQDYYPVDHECHDPHGPVVCHLQDRIKAVDVAGVDMIINAHRGVWGLNLNDPVAGDDPDHYFNIDEVTVGGAAENSFEGLLEAHNSSFETVEFDVFLVRQDIEGQPTAAGQVFITHFTDYRGFTNSTGPQTVPATGIAGAQGFLMTTPASEVAGISSLRLRDRDGAVTPSTLYPLRDFVSAAASRGMLVVLDVKFAKSLGQLRWREAGVKNGVPYPAGFASKVIGFDGAYPAATGSLIADCKSGAHQVVNGSSEEQTLSTIAAINTQLNRSAPWDTDLRPYVIIKFPQSAVPCPSLLQARLGEHFDHLLYAPNPDTKLPQNITSSEALYTTQYVEEWRRIGPRSVAFWDTSIPSTAHWQGHEVTLPGPDGQPTVYADLMDYLLKTTGRRSAIWNIDPSGPGGRHGNFGMAWDQNPNTATDTRGDQNANLVFSGAKHALVTTDRPDIYLVLRDFIGSLDE